MFQIKSKIIIIGKMKINRFKAWRPLNDLVEEVASVPYDVVDRQQAQKISGGQSK